MAEGRHPGGEAGEPFLLVGRIRKPHGIRGELFVWVETDQPDAVFQPGRALFLGDDQGAPLGEVLTVERARPFKDGVLLHAREHTSRTEALEALRGRTLLMPRSQAAPLSEGEVFYHDLIGLRVVAGGETVGTVKDVYETAGADLLVVQRQPKGEAYVPFVREMIRQIDLDAGVLEIDPPPGLLEL